MTPYAARLHLGLSVTGMAEVLGMNRRSVQRMERGQWPTTPRTKKQIAALIAAHDAAGRP